MSASKQHKAAGMPSGYLLHEKKMAVMAWRRRKPFVISREGAVRAARVWHARGIGSMWPRRGLSQW